MAHPSISFPLQSQQRNIADITTGGDSKSNHIEQITRWSLNQSSITKFFVRIFHFFVWLMSFCLPSSEKQGNILKQRTNPIETPHHTPICSSAPIETASIKRSNTTPHALLSNTENQIVSAALQEGCIANIQTHINNEPLISAKCENDPMVEWTFATICSWGQSVLQDHPNNQELNNIIAKFTNAVDNARNMHYLQQDIQAIDAALDSLCLSANNSHHITTLQQLSYLFKLSCRLQDVNASITTLHTQKQEIITSSQTNPPTNKQGFCAIARSLALNDFALRWANAERDFVLTFHDKRRNELNKTEMVCDDEDAIIQQATLRILQSLPFAKEEFQNALANFALFPEKTSQQDKNEILDYVSTIVFPEPWSKSMSIFLSETTPLEPIVDLSMIQLSHPTSYTIEKKQEIRASIETMRRDTINMYAGGTLHIMQSNDTGTTPMINQADIWMQELLSSHPEI